MPIPIADAQPGAYVEEYFDKGGRPLPVRRRGWITKIEYPDGAAFDTMQIAKVYALFDEEKGPEPVALSTLNLVRRADEAALSKIKQLDQDRRAEEILATVDEEGPVHPSTGKHRKGVVVDRTGVETPRSGKGLSPIDAQKL